MLFSVPVVKQHFLTGTLLQDLFLHGNGTVRTDLSV
mgnify:CR=1 FL=1